MTHAEFPKDFIWGAATAAYQVEGAVAGDGRGPSVWDMLCRKPGAVWRGETGDEACDHYHRWREDVGLMRDMGLRAYRFSIAWPRVLPAGTGKVNRKGLAFYDRLVDALLDAGIEPWVTLFHWDFPLALYHRGGWLNPESPRWFADYTRVVVDALSDRVGRWITHNEPQCFISLGLEDGRHAPADRLARAEYLQAGHHALMAHGEAVRVIRSRARRKPLVGMAPCGTTKMPASGRPADLRAARRAMFCVGEQGLWSTDWWMDPPVFGHYPEDAVRFFGKDAPKAGPRDMDVIRQPMDFLGLNIYHGQRVRALPGGKRRDVTHPVGHPITAFYWPVEPDALYWGPRLYHERYRLPIVVTENGMSNADVVSLDGKVHDPQRIDFMARYLQALRRAVAGGVDVRGYFHWSLMDNFEWAEGYKQRFGLVFVDYPTRRRIPKDSAAWYARVIATNGASLDDA